MLLTNVLFVWVTNSSLFCSEMNIFLAAGYFLAYCHWWTNEHKLSRRQTSQFQVKIWSWTGHRFNTIIINVLVLTTDILHILHILVEWFIILKIFINLLTYNINNLEKNIYSCFKTSKTAFGAYSQKQKNTSQNRLNVHGWLLVEGNENFLDYHGRFILDGFIQQSWTNFLRPWKWKEWIITEHVGWDLYWI